jgi:hypothetical protein
MDEGAGQQEPGIWLISGSTLDFSASSYVRKKFLLFIKSYSACCILLQQPERIKISEVKEVFLPHVRDLHKDVYVYTYIYTSK